MLTPSQVIGVILSHKKGTSRAYYAQNKDSKCAYERARYVLAEPKPDAKEMYMKQIQVCMLDDKKHK